MNGCKTCAYAKWLHIPQWKCNKAGTTPFVSHFEHHLSLLWMIFETYSKQKWTHFVQTHHSHIPVRLSSCIMYHTIPPKKTQWIDELEIVACEFRTTGGKTENKTGRLQILHPKSNNSPLKIKMIHFLLRNGPFLGYRYSFIFWGEGYHIIPYRIHVWYLYTIPIHLP